MESEFEKYKSLLGSALKTWYVEKCHFPEQDAESCKIQVMGKLKCGQNDLIERAIILMKKANCANYCDPNIDFQVWKSGWDTAIKIFEETFNELGFKK